jgi:hypothetical protein
MPKNSKTRQLIGTSRIGSSRVESRRKGEGEGEGGRRGEPQDRSKETMVGNVDGEIKFGKGREREARE